MPPKSPSKQEMMNQKIDFLQQKVEEIEKRNEYLGKNIQEFIEKQQEKKQTLLPLQRLFGFSVAGLLAILGLIVIIYSNVKIDDNNIKDHLYIYGSILILFAIIIAICIHFYTNYMSKTYTIGGKILNSFEVEPPGLKNLLKK